MLTAITVYGDLIDRSPAPDLHGELAKLYNRVGRADDAAAQVAAGLELGRATADRFPAERRHLIGFFADHDTAEALRLAELDLAERQDIHSHAWYAWALLQNGNERAALDAIAPALSTRTDDPWIRYQAGSIYAVNQMPAEAASMLTAALDMNPQFDIVHAERARELLADL